MSEDEIIENKTDDLTVYGYKRNKFAGFGEYENDILKENEGRINELVEITKKEFQIKILKFFLKLGFLPPILLSSVWLFFFISSLSF